MLGARISWLQCPVGFRASNYRAARSYGSISSTGALSTQRASLSRIFLPTGGLAEAENEDAHSKLIRAGFLRQSNAGIFHMLPLGQRVQEKLERLIDKYMQQVGASKLSLSSISSQALWERTRRLEGYGPELFRFTDRKNVGYLLAPTHEEEITTLIAKSVQSYKQLPLRVYQIGRKYRDEMRPRHGTLRSREFLMKDLYTFDSTVESALSTYEEVRAAYSRLFDELKLPYLVAEASSGDIGGDLSHEYHLPASVGEDVVMKCDSCSYVANEELAVAGAGSQTWSDSPDDAALHGKTDSPRSEGSTPPETRCWHGVSKDRSKLINVWYPRVSGLTNADINTHAVKALCEDTDTSVSSPLDSWTSTLREHAASKTDIKIVHIVDRRLDPALFDAQRSSPKLPEMKHLTDMDDVWAHVTSLVKHEWIFTSPDGNPIDLLRIRDGDSCAQCSSGKLRVQKAVELGHTFHLGTRYSEPLGANVVLRNQSNVPIQMGCHGIGVSRIIGAVADHLADKKGLNWPCAIAPFEAVLIPGKDLADASNLYDHLTANHDSAKPGLKLPLDVVVDDRSEPFGFKMKDADLVGYPVIVLMGRKWASERLCEVQCRRLGVKEDVPYDELPLYISKLLSQL